MISYSGEITIISYSKIQKFVSENIKDERCRILQSFLGMQTLCDLNFIFMNQAAYSNRFLERFNSKLLISGGSIPQRCREYRNCQYGMENCTGL